MIKHRLKTVLPAIALILGLLIGLGVGQFQVASAKKSAQEKIREANKKVAVQQSVGDVNFFEVEAVDDFFSQLILG